MGPATDFPVATFLLAALALVVALVLLLLGLRGKRVDDHPICRKCGFDLFGLSQDRHTCSECGADLTQSRATRTGHRKRRRGFLAMGGVFLIMAMGLTGIGIRIVPTNLLYQYAPVWWLVFQAQQHDSSQSKLALDELLGRLDKNLLSQNHINRVVHAALKTQASPQIPWQSRWGTFVEKAHSIGMVHASDWDQYWENAIKFVEFTLTFRQHVARGDPLPFEIRFQGERIGTHCEKLYVFEGQRFHDGHQGQTDARRLAVSSYLGTLQKYSTGGSILLNKEWVAALSDGLHSGELWVSFALAIRHETDAYTWTEKCRKEHPVRVPWELLPVGVESAHAVIDESARQAMRNAIDDMELYIFRQRSGDLSLFGKFVVTSAPYSVAFDMVAVDEEGREIKLGQYTLPAQQHEIRNISLHYLTSFSAKTVDLKLRPSKQAAVNSMDVYEYWGETIVIEDVPIDWSRLEEQ